MCGAHRRNDLDHSCHRRASRPCCLAKKSIDLLYANEVSLDLNLRPLEKKSIKRFAKTAGISFRRPLKKQGNLCMRLDLETGTAITEKNLLVHTDVEEDV